MDDYVKPLVDEYERLDQQLKRAEAEIAEMRERRNRLRTAVRSLSPETLGEKPKTTTKAAKKSYPVSDESVGLVRRVVSGLNGDQFTPADLLAWFGQRLPAEGTVRAGLRVMHANGEIRLVSTGRGGQKTYEVIR